MRANEEIRKHTGPAAACGPITLKYFACEKKCRSWYLREFESGISEEPINLLDSRIPN
jgi:hypothetical protein